MNRRSFLKQSSAAAVGLLAPRSRSAELPATRIVDTHTHFYDPTRPEGVPWPDKATPLDRPVLPRDFLSVSSPLGITQTVVVEASDWLEDNQWILNLAAEQKAIVGFIGNLRPNHPDFAAQLKRFAANPLFRGIRVSDPDFLGYVDDPAFRAGIARLADAGLSLDLNGPSEQHAAAAQLARDFPSLRIIIDHVGSAGDPSHLTREWRESISAFSKHRHVACKISALIEQTDASDTRWGDAPRQTAFYAPILDHCCACFGEDRLLYASNWPVCEKGGTYVDQWRIVSEYFSARSSAQREKFFWQNSRAFYAWNERE